MNGNGNSSFIKWLIGTLTVIFSAFIMGVAAWGFTSLLNTRDLTLQHEQRIIQLQRDYDRLNNNLEITNALLREFLRKEREEK